ncbi:hypothetical protein HANVADRAFT_54376 [Hanseniaspora valbyensis NRRL Y-1626]|uniref:Uncharacterized protein n=1 Tax=Hanseniaspora valbyensis NRRL Y-1626 TaxID=766949 RepID=A0A1B7T7D6_9ASCO|nr:hypothetical protein HANVADRAFT_54376 [Hanseniaspora valbyensis NRRL Y-1626]
MLLYAFLMYVCAGKLNNNLPDYNKNIATPIKDMGRCKLENPKFKKKKLFL